MKNVLGTILVLTILLLSRLAAGQAVPGSLDDQLLNSAMDGDTATVQQLLQQGAHIEAKDNYGHTALITAAIFGKADVVLLLLEKGANIEAKDSRSGDTALIHAAKEGHADVVKLLLDKGANIEAKNKDGETALLEAAEQGKADALKVLLDKGANTEVKNSYGATALIEAIIQRKIGAVIIRNTDVVKLLLDRGANTEAKNTDGWTALMEAASSGQTDAVKLLLDKGANTETKANDGQTALIKAAMLGMPDAVKLLLDKGANTEAKDNTGMTALIWAAGKDNAGVKMLLDRGANIEAKSSDGTTALMEAALEDKTEIVKLLLDKGASINAKNMYGRTALSVAKSDVAAVLKQALAQNPSTMLAEYVNQFQWNPYNDAARERVIQLAAGLSELPAIPDEAKQLFLQASALMKQTTTPEEMQKPIKLLQKALEIAPWWGNAYYNLSRAWELDGQYDEAVRQLNHYLELKPSEADAAEARAHIAVIQAEKETAEGKKQENESILAVKYVSGGITRLRDDDAPKWWHNSGSIDSLYNYFVPQEYPFYINVFRFPNGHYLAISLIAQSNNGAYAGDRIGVYDITDNSCIWGNDFAFGAQDYSAPCGGRYYVSVSNQPNATVTVTYPATGASVTVPAALLYRGRAHEAMVLGGCGSGTVRQGGTRVMVLHFDCSVVLAAEDPAVNAAGLTPTTVKPE